MQIRAYFDQPAGAFPHFWTSTGFTPAKLLLGEDMHQALSYMASIPRGGIRYVRIHYLLDLVGVEAPYSEQPCYDWTNLDRGLDWLVGRGLHPFFELMGSPGGFFENFHAPAQVYGWKRLVRGLAEHAIQRYGISRVREWLFECWNEPDIHFWQQDDAALCRYYDACAQGLLEAEPSLKLGGPGTCRNLSQTLRSFLAHCDQGSNFFSGAGGTRLDFISLHEKGARSSTRDLTPDTQGIVEREKRVIEYIRGQHPRFARLPFCNNECDPQTGWQQDHTWRAKPYYAALAIRVIDQHLRALIDGMGVNYGPLSNDNGFLGGWGQRTLLSRFSPVEDLESGQADFQRSDQRYRFAGQTPGFELVKKPIFNAMHLLALLGDQRVLLELEAGKGDELGALCTLTEGPAGEKQAALLIYHSRDAIRAKGSEPVRLEMKGLPFSRGMLAHYRIDAGHSHPFAVWERLGSPRLPSREALAAMRSAAELSLYEEPHQVEIQPTRLTLTFDLPLPGASLLLLTASGEQVPEASSEPRLRRYHGLDGRENLMLEWEPSPTLGIKTYEVLRAGQPSGPYQRLSPHDNPGACYLHPDVPADSTGWYKVRAVDWWGRSAESKPIEA